MSKQFSDSPMLINLSCALIFFCVFFGFVAKLHVASHKSANLSRINVLFLYFSSFELLRIKSVVLCV